MKTPVRIGIVGMGGFAGSHHDAVLKLEERKLARLVCTCDPHRDSFLPQQSAWRLRERGVYVFADYPSMLATCARHLDLLVVPTPVHLHAEIHRAAVEAGLAVYLEKPPTLDHAELEQMIARDRQARKAALVGFNFIIEPPRQSLKRRLLDGEFGRLREVRLRAVWSRPTSYFRRCPSAGRIFLGEQLVLDSCLSNELAHFVHNALFWAGSSEVLSWPELASVQAELYRAHLIESADTACAEARTTDGVAVRLAVSLAHAGPCSHAETIVCDAATIDYVVGQGASVRWSSGNVEKIAWEPFDPLVENHLAYLRYLLGETPRPATHPRRHAGLRGPQWPRVSLQREGLRPALRAGVPRPQLEGAERLPVGGRARNGARRLPPAAPLAEPKRLVPTGARAARHSGRPAPAGGKPPPAFHAPCTLKLLARRHLQ